MQDDLFFSRLTVRETLEFTARIRLPSRYTLEEKQERVQDVMSRLRLEKCADTRIGDQQFDKGISGGERKRVNIANELLHQPRVLLADEPISGLDSSSAYTVIQLLRELSSEGRTVITTIHQPSSKMFYIFDKVMLLGSGRVAYFGKPSEVMRYFNSIGFPFPSTAYNPADYMLELIIDSAAKEDTDDEPGASVQQRILDAWHAHEQQESNVAPSACAKDGTVIVELESESEDTSSGDAAPVGEGDYHPDGIHSKKQFLSRKSQPDPEESHERFFRFSRSCCARAIYKRYLDLTGQHGKDGMEDKYPTGWWTQVYILGRRAIRQKRGNLLEKSYVLQVIAVTVICALFWFQMEFREDSIDDRLGAVFFFGVFWGFFSIFSALYTFPAERAVLNKDRASGAYRLSAYYFAKTTVWWKELSSHNWWLMRPIPLIRELE